MSDTTLPRRARKRPNVWLAVAGLAVVAVVGGWLAFRALAPGPDSAHDTVAELLDAWRRSDMETVARFTSGPPTVVRSAYRQQAEALGGWPTADIPPKTHAWFIGFRGDLAFAVLVEGGGVGGRVAAPIARSLLAAG